MTALTRRVWALYDTGSDHDRRPTVREGSQQILDGLAAAFDIRAVIQQALGVIMARRQVAADTAYIILRAKAADTGATPTATATAAIQEQDA